MRNLALLVRKDFISAMVSYSNLAVLLIVFLAVVAVNAPLVFIIVVYLMVINLFAAEESDLVCNVTGILPIRMQQAVLARYVYAWLLLLITAIVGGVVSAILNTLFFERSGWFEQLLFALASALFMVSVIMPLNYKFGVMKTRIFSMIFYIAMALVASVVTSLSGEYMATAPQTLPISGIAGIAVGLTFALSVISLFIAMAIKKN